MIDLLIIVHSDRYGDKHFEEELQKVLNRFGDLFDARIIAVTVRPGTQGVMSSMYEFILLSPQANEADKWLSEIVWSPKGRQSL